MRMGADRPKQFLEIRGIPLLIYTLLPFLHADRICAVTVVTHQDWKVYTEKLVQRYLPEAGIRIICGGGSRHDSLMAAVCDFEEAGLTEEDPVLVTHDAARPGVTEKILEENIDAAIRYGACATMVPAVDTIAVSADGLVIDEIPKRETMYQMQTPQTFRYSVLKGCVNRLREEQKASLTDAAGILLMQRVPVHIVQGSRENLKVTYPQDLQTVEIAVANRYDFGYNMKNFEGGCLHE